MTGLKMESMMKVLRKDRYKKKRADEEKWNWRLISNGKRI